MPQLLTKTFFPSDHPTLLSASIVRKVYLSEWRRFNTTDGKVVGKLNHLRLILCLLTDSASMFKLIPACGVLSHKKRKENKGNSRSVNHVFSWIIQNTLMHTICHSGPLSRAILYPTLCFSFLNTSPFI